MPVGQDVHTPPDTEYWLAEQFVHAVATFEPAGEDFPAAQAVHTPPAMAYVPAGQVSQAVWAAFEEVPAVQLVHVPPAEEILPSAHATQDEPLSSYPALQVNEHVWVVVLHEPVPFAVVQSASFTQA